MGLFFFFYSFLCFVLLISRSFSSSFEHHLCSPTEASALLQFKQHFEIISDPNSLCPIHFPRTMSWNESRDCCIWNGVTCDMLTGHVIALDLSCSQLWGSIHPNSSLFQLHHLHTLNLAYNNFNYSSIPHNIGQLTNLRHLNLSVSGFDGQIPTEISYLSNLVSLDLSGYELQLDERTFETMLHNFTNLELLSLSQVNITSPIPMNMSSSLRYVDLGFTNLRGVLPESLFLLPNLEKLKLGVNLLLKGVLPKIPMSNTLLELDISFTGISGSIPDSIGTLSSLNILNLQECQFSGSIPDSIGNLTQITELILSSNHFTGHIPSTISKLKHLTRLDLSSNSFSGEIPNVFSNLQELRYLHLYDNSLIGSFPSTISNLTHLESLVLSSNSLSGPLPANKASILQKLTELDLSNNSLNGTIPSWVFNLPSVDSLWLQNNQFSGLPDEIKTNPTLKYLHLSNNQLSGSLHQSLANLTNLSTLDLSTNNITGDAGTNITFPRLQVLQLSCCELKDFPYFLRNVKTLSVLDMSKNKIRGQIPNWFSGMRWDSLESLNLSHNSLTGHLPPFHYHSLDDPSHAPQPLESEEDEDESYFLSGFTWESLVIGYSFGLVVGTIIWSLMFKCCKPKWFVEFFEGIFPKKMRSLCFSSSIDHHLCSPSEASALLQFKQSFNILDFSPCDTSFPKTVSWNESNDCCTWDGVTCDMLNGHVIALDLSCSQLNGTIYPNSSLIQLHHLQALNLAKNYFYPSTIPNDFSRLRNLKHLNLSDAYFQGEIPTEISYLSNLVSLDLSVPSYVNGLQFDQKTFEAVLQNLTNLEVLSLFGVNVSSPIPMNLSSSLRYIDLKVTNLEGVLTESLFLLPNLETLYLSNNYLLKGVLPKIHPSNTLLELDISYTGISGELPDSIGTLSSLTRLYLYGCQFSGRIPDSIGNLTQIRYLNFGNNHFTGNIPSTISKLKHLAVLALSSNSFGGEIPNFFSNLQELRYLSLSNCSFIGPFPSPLLSLTQLETLDLSRNSLSGPLPRNASMLQKLAELDLSYNSLNGTIPSWVFTLPLLSSVLLHYNQLSGSFPQSPVNLTNLSTLDLSSNNITLDAGIQITLPSLEILQLSSCELKDFPHFLRNVKTLMVLDISNNKIRGQIPNWFSGMRWDSLLHLNLSHNSLTGNLQQLHYNSLDGFTWESVVIGYSFGLIVGTVMWSLMFKYRKPKWFVEFIESISFNCLRSLTNIKHIFLRYYRQVRIINYLTTEHSKFSFLWKA
ncbi:hypothetical protein H5410_059289 [Solanum commersonii]|uniref:Leucine-rich repeat-containing N-terminal plant-type domain-containing protein n=1 Tax=Solanum commersonii TaxID=4109 RepID=A0A9J5W1Y8_SOLCO|nr:hypothetical protein H5410_059289 [Solanum commersonii]